MRCEDRVEAYIRRMGLLKPEGLHLVALSGGADSVALLLILRQLGYRIEAVHCNFHLRGEESDRDEAFVVGLCQKHQIPLHKAHFETRDYAALHKVSIEMAARELRYRYFEQLRQDMGADSICVAHHQDDSVETLLMNLMRGTGIHGLTGIRAKNGFVVRPMLCLNRQEIEEYLDSIGQSYVTDSTNLVDDVLRNRIRLNLVPLMRQILPQSSAAIAKTAENLQEVENVFFQAMEFQISAAVKKCKSQVVGLPDVDYAVVDFDDLQHLPSPESFLFEWLSPFGFSPAQILQINSHSIDLSAMEPGKVFTSSTHQLFIDRSRLLLAPQDLPIPSLKIPEEGTYAYQGDKRFKCSISDKITISKSVDCATFDKDRVQFPLQIRPWAAGDRFCPYGMKGSRLVSDYLTDLKLSLWEKRRQLVMVDGHGEVIWLVGQRIDHRFRITDSTSSVLRIEVI